MVLTLNSLRFSLSHAQVQAARLIDARLRGSDALARLSGRRGHGGPLSIGNIDKFAQQDLVLATDYNILL